MFVDDLEQPVLGDAERHHLGRVLRLHAWETITVADGGGRWREARLGDPVEVVGDVHLESVRSSRGLVGFSLLNG